MLGGAALHGVAARSLLAHLLKLQGEGRAVQAAEGPSITLDGEMAARLGTSPRTRYTQDYTAALSALPDGWGLVLDAPPGRRPYCIAIGNQRVGAEARTHVNAVLAAACLARGYMENLAIRQAKEAELLAARQAGRPAADFVQEPAP